MSKDKVFFASDFHLGMDSHQSSRDRETKIVQWLDHIAPMAERIFLVGDVFDHWYEYKYVVPKGFFRLLSSLEQITSSGTIVHYLPGNHDLWHRTYLQEEIGLIMEENPVIFYHQGKKMYIAHGDGLNPKDYKYTFLKYLLGHKVSKALFSKLHPDWGVSLMRRMSYWSRKNHAYHLDNLIANQEAILFCERLCKQYADMDYIVMGHWHYPILHTLSNGF